LQGLQGLQELQRSPATPATLQPLHSLQPLSDHVQTLLYRIGVGGYHLAIRLAALFGRSQARKWVSGRREQRLMEIRPTLLQEPSLHLRPRLLIRPGGGEGTPRNSRHGS